MKYFILFATLLLVTTNLLSQDLKTTIQEKIWRLNEFYVDNDLSGDTLYVYFTYNNIFKSASTPTELTTTPTFSLLQLNEPSVYYPPPDQSVYSVSGQSITINESEESYKFEVAYFDNDDLIVILQDTATVYGIDGDDSFHPYTLEYRFVLDQ